MLTTTTTATPAMLRYHELAAMAFPDIDFVNAYTCVMVSQLPDGHVCGSIGIHFIGAYTGERISFSERIIGGKSLTRNKVAHLVSRRYHSHLS